jgi:hypothetical protein
MTIETPPKYAEVMVRKKIEDSGEFDESVSIITHWKKKSDRNTTHIFFTALPTRLYQSHFVSTAHQSDSVLVFPLYTILYSLLKRRAKTRPMAVVFQHDRFADILIGNKHSVYYANRVSAFDTSDEQISNLWETVKGDIASAESDYKITVGDIVVVDWIDSARAPTLPQTLIKKTSFLESRQVWLNGKACQASLLTALTRQGSLESASSNREKFLYLCERSLPWLNASLALTLLICVGGYWWCNQQSDVLAYEADGLHRRINTVRSETSAPHTSYEDVLPFVKDLERYHRMPSFKTVVNDLSGALSKTMSVEVLKVDYGENDLTIEIFGRATTTFDQAHKGYLRFLGLLQKNGYTIVESNFDTKIEASSFLTRLNKKI